MKRNIFIFLILFIVVFPFLSFAESEDKITGDISVSSFNAFMFRGKELSRNSIVLQPSVTIGYKGLAVNFWGNFDRKPYSDSGSELSSTYTETDYTITYSQKVGPLTITPGYIYYGIGSPCNECSDIPDSQEGFLSLSLDTILQPTITVYKEFWNYDQWYFLLGLSQTIELNKYISLKLSASASYLLSTDANTYPRFDNNSLPTSDKFENFHDGVVSIAIPISFYKNFSLTPVVSYMFPLSTDARYEMKGRGLEAVLPSDRDSSYLYGGITLSCTF